MTEIQLLHVTELLSQLGNQVVETDRDKAVFKIGLTGNRWIRIWPDGEKEWYRWCKRSRWLKLHRTDGPARERANGDKEWFRNNKIHRTDGPAIELANGDKEWWLNSQRHRTDGPAVELANGNKEWWLNNVKQTGSV